MISGTTKEIKKHHLGTNLEISKGLARCPSIIEEEPMIGQSNKVRLDWLRCQIQPGRVAFEGTNTIEMILSRHQSHRNEPGEHHSTHLIEAAIDQYKREKDWANGRVLKYVEPLYRKQTLRTISHKSASSFDSEERKRSIV